MNLQHLNIKIFVDGELAVGWEKFIEVFHVWTAEQSLPEMMIDVADYRHVPNGPGVVMVGHEADYFMDNTDGRPGLRYNSKIAKSGTNEELLRQAFEAAASVCARLEQELPGLRFARDGFELSVNDRALMPNTDATVELAKQELPSLLQQAFGQAGELRFEQDRRKLFGAQVRFDQPLELVAVG